MTLFSPDGVCYSLDHRANGYDRDGIDGVLLKAVRQALADGDTIRAAICGTGLNQDGKTLGITIPSPEAQADLIMSTYAAAGLSLEKTAYFEAHGECVIKHISFVKFVYFCGNRYRHRRPI
jgi:acyl transferase domain-containing protein